MKTKLLFLGALLFSMSFVFGQTVVTRKTLPYYEGFSYDVDSKLLTENSIAGQGGWQTFNGDIAAVAGSNPVIVSDPGWNMGGLPTPTFNALRFWSSGDDPVINFTDQGAEFAIYSSFIFRIPTPVSPEIDSWNDTVGEYIYSFGKTSTSNTVNYTSNVYLKKTSAAATTFNIGIAETNTTAAGRLIWASGTYSYDTDIRIVIKYQIDATNPTGLSTLWINPVTNSATEPLTSDANTVTDNGTTAARNNLDKIRIMKSAQAKTPYIILDEIRVANTWDQVSGPGAILSVAKNEIAGLSVYPNPVSNGKVYISSDSSEAKNVLVYDILGKQLIQKEVSNGTLDVSSLNKGVYLMKVSEGAASSTRKLIIE
jgi:hypothetical protein